MKVKLLIIISLLSVSQFVAAQNFRISGFNELMLSLNSGERLRVIIDYSLCNWAFAEESQKPLPKAVVGMDIDTYEYFAPGAVRNKSAFMVFSQSKLIQNPMGKGFVYNYGKVRINDDNTVVVSAKYIHPKSFKVLMDETFSGKLNDGINGGGVSIFK